MTGIAGLAAWTPGICTRLLPALAALLAAVAQPVAAQGDAAGRFIVVSGDVKVLGADGVTRAAVRDGALQQGDSIVTGANSLAQLRMSDGGAVSVRAETQLKLDSYRFRGSDDRESSFAVSIIKGGFRAITGLIARNNRQNYRVSTSSMTLGVRGTHFEVVHVLQPVSDAPAGSYNRVFDGTMTVQNRAGVTLVASPGQTVFVALPSNRPPVLVAPPIAIYGKPTPVPQLAPQSRQGDLKPEAAAPAGEAAQKAPAAVRGTTPATGVAPSGTLSTPLLNPIDTPRALETAPTATTISPALISPTLISPTTTTISPEKATISPATTISPTTTTISPTTTTISPTLVSPTTTTLSPTTTTISPTLTAPATISPTLISPTTTTISPTLISPTTTTISPTTTTIQTAPTTIQTAPTLIQTVPTTTIKR